MVYVERESLDFMGCEFERCFRCKQPTPYWYAPKDVPCCKDCAAVVEANEIPTKSEWVKSLTFADSEK
jgi:hypothetical protein